MQVYDVFSSIDGPYSDRGGMLQRKIKLSNQAVDLFAAIVLAVSAIATPTGQALAQDLALECRRVGPFPNQSATFHYKGAAAGTLSAQGAFGNMALPARRSVRKSMGPEGAAVIDASGQVPALMPTRSAIEACLKRLKNPTNDADIAFMHLVGCQNQVAAATTPVNAAVSIEITSAKIGTEFMTEVKMKREPIDAKGGDPKLLRLETEFTCEIAR